MTNLLYDTPVNAPLPAWTQAPARISRRNAGSGDRSESFPPPACGTNPPRARQTAPAAHRLPPIDELGPSHDASGALLFEPARDVDEHST